MTKKTNEWTVDAPWGKIAVVSWGDATKSPILMLHGYVDSTATFIYLVQDLPDDYYYVAFDMPGHGKSDPFPPGLIQSQLTIVEVMRIVVDHMQWDNFIYLAHSMACVIGLFYNYVHPGKISQMVLLDPGPPLAMYYYVHYKPSVWYSFLYNPYYSDYDKYHSKTPKLYSHEDAVGLTALNRNLTMEQAELLLSRSLVPVGDMYRFSMDPRMKFLANIPVSEETIHKSVTNNTTPTLILEASKSTTVEPGTSFAKKVLEKCRAMPNYWKIRVIGGHDFHITDPGVVAKHVMRFLSGKTCVANSIQSKI